MNIITETFNKSVEATQSANSSTTLQCVVEPYDRYVRNRVCNITVTGKTLLQALTKLVDRLQVYVTVDQINEEELSAEDILSLLESSNGDGCDMIYLLKNKNTGEVYIDEEDI